MCLAPRDKNHILKLKLNRGVASVFGAQGQESYLKLKLDRGVASVFGAQGQDSYFEAEARQRRSYCGWRPETRIIF